MFRFDPDLSDPADLSDLDLSDLFDEIMANIRDPKVSSRT
jgi:hypothetical protein